MKWIAIIRNSKNREEAAAAISSRSWTLHSDIINLLDVSARPDDLEENLGIQGEQYYLSPAQVNAILELRLHRLTGIAFEEVVKEYEELLVKIADLLHILSSAKSLMEVIREELEEVKAQFGWWSFNWNYRSFWRYWFRRFNRTRRRGCDAFSRRLCEIPTIDWLWSTTSWR